MRALAQTPDLLPLAIGCTHFLVESERAYDPIVIIDAMLEELH